MEKTKRINQKQVKKVSEKVFFDSVVGVMRENLVAIFTRENENSICVKLVNGQRFRMSVEEA